MDEAVVQLVVAVGFAVLAAALAWRWRLGLDRELAIAAARATAQLLVVGAFVALVFEAPGLSAVFIAVMLTTATFVAGGRLAPLPAARRTAAVAIAAPALTALGLLVATGAFDAEPRAIVPGAGILIGGAMTAVGLAGRRFHEGLVDGAEEVEARLSLGDAARDALDPLAVRAVRTAMLPIVDQTRSVGLVTLPGTFVGLVLGGASAGEAARIQLLVLLALLAVELVAARLATTLAVRASILPGERVATP
ncbi:ABC transporter permease [Conexibacter sp. SYSU D00693]|uniref:ABC transporter permease n=1 Tax=Conexibacter sp. SYSU D00693 TaxID=2812560 RepID=UPI00196A9A85|nr:ABC transporter permease [Conexibacter sp. SYSU D00693]